MARVSCDPVQLHPSREAIPRLRGGLSSPKRNVIERTREACPLARPAPPEPG